MQRFKLKKFAAHKTFFFNPPKSVATCMLGDDKNGQNYRTDDTKENLILPKSALLYSGYNYVYVR